MDACNWDLICSQPAFWVGILYDDEILDKVKEVTEGWTNEDRYYLNQRVPEEGLQTKFKQKKIIDFKNIAILFGPENSGLSNQDIRLANFLFTIPTHNSNKSLNLSHAVSLMSYELSKLNKISTKEAISANDSKVSKLELSNFMNFLINDLDSSGFFLPKEKKANMIDNIYSIYNKFGLSKKELRMLWGMHKKLKNQPKT